MTNEHANHSEQISLQSFDLSCMIRAWLPKPFPSNLTLTSASKQPKVQEIPSRMLSDAQHSRKSLSLVKIFFCSFKNVDRCFRNLS